MLLRRRLVRGDRLEARHHGQLVLDQQDVSSVLLNRLYFWHFGNIFSLQTSNGEVSNMKILGLFTINSYLKRVGRQRCSNPELSQLHLHLAGLVLQQTALPVSHGVLPVR